jgi:hypothetical protein
MRPLSYRQRLFVEFYLGESSESAADAARRAGYQSPEKLGPRLVEESGVRAAITADFRGQKPHDNVTFVRGVKDTRTPRAILPAMGPADSPDRARLL